MSDNQLSRRKVLTALATTGGAGAVGGIGTGAFFSDEESFTNNGITASKSVAGTVDLEVDVASLSDAEGVKYSVNLPEGVNNNPSNVWVRAETCPPDSADHIDVKVQLVCDGHSQLIAEGTLKDVLEALRQGTKLECDGSCFQPGESADLELEVTDVRPGAQSGIEFVFEFYAEQCRYNTDVDNPFDPLSDCEETDTSGKAISFIAFCSESGETLNPDITAINSEKDGEPTSVDWTTDAGVDYVVVKSGQNFTIYDYNGADSGTATTGGDPDADFYGRVSGGAKNGFSEGADGPGSGNNASSVPCELAADIVGDGDFPDGGTSTKLEADKGEIQS